MVRDNSDRIVDLLEDIAGQQSGFRQTAGATGDTKLSQSYLVQESADNDESEADGSMLFHPGDRKPIVYYDVPAGSTVRVYAVGANDVNDMKFAVVADDDKHIGGWTNSPLGTIPQPYSFPEMTGGYVEAEHRIAILGKLDASHGSTESVVGRIHLEIA